MGLGVTIPESDLTVLEIEDVWVADGHAKDIGSQVLQSGVGGPGSDSMLLT